MCTNEITRYTASSYSNLIFGRFLPLVMRTMRQRIRFSRVQPTPSSALVLVSGHQKLTETRHRQHLEGTMAALHKISQPFHGLHCSLSSYDVQQEVGWAWEAEGVAETEGAVYRLYELDDWRGYAASGSSVCVCVGGGLSKGKGLLCAVRHTVHSPILIKTIIRNDIATQACNNAHTPHPSHHTYLRPYSLWTELCELIQ